MSTLPAEIWLVILKNSSFEDLVQVAGVSKSFNALAKQIIGSIEQIQLKEYDSPDHDLQNRSFILFEKVNSFIVQFRKWQNNVDHWDPFFNFLATHCPNLTVLDARRITIRAETLIKLSQRLNYFSFFRVLDSPDPSNKLKVDHFPNLMAFDLNNSKDLSDLRKQLMKTNEKFIQGEHSMFSDFPPLSSSIESLRISTMQLVPTIHTWQADCPIESGPNESSGHTFSKLKLLSVQTRVFDFESLFSSLSVATSLKVLSLDGFSDGNLMEKLSSLLFRWDKIQFFYFAASEDIRSPFTVPIGPKLSHLRIELDSKVILVNPVSKRLRHLDISATSIEPNVFDFVNLSTLRLKLPGHSDAEPVFRSILRCNSVARVDLHLKPNDKLKFEQVLVFLKEGHLPFQGLKSLHSSCNFGHEFGSHVSVRLNFEWCDSGMQVTDALPAKIFAAGVAFDCTWVLGDRCVRLNTSKKGSSVVGTLRDLAPLCKFSDSGTSFEANQRT